MVRSNTDGVLRQFGDLRGLLGDKRTPDRAWTGITISLQT